MKKLSLMWSHASELWYSESLKQLMYCAVGVWLKWVAVTLAVGWWHVVWRQVKEWCRERELPGLWSVELRKLWLKMSKWKAVILTYEYLVLKRVLSIGLKTCVGQRGCAAWERYISVYRIAVAVATTVEAVNTIVRYLNEAERSHQQLAALLGTQWIVCDIFLCLKCKEVCKTSGGHIIAHLCKYCDVLFYAAVTEFAFGVVERGMTEWTQSWWNVMWGFVAVC